MNSGPRRDTLSFLGLVFSASMVVAVALPHSPAAPLISAFIPVAALLVLTPFLGRSVWRGLGLNRAGFRLWPAAIAVPAVAAAVGYAVASGLGLMQAFSVIRSSLPTLIIVAAIATVVVLGEEVGWRGFLLPRMQQLTTPRNAAILTAAAHAAVHLPVILLTTTYNSQGSRWVIAPLTMITITAAGIFYAWLRDSSQSIWPAAIAHAAGNTLLAFVASAALPAASVSMAYIAGEGGWVTAVVMTAVAIAVLRIASRTVWRPAEQSQLIST